MRRSYRYDRLGLGPLEPWMDLGREPSRRFVEQIPVVTKTLVGEIPTATSTLLDPTPTSAFVEQTSAVTDTLPKRSAVITGIFYKYFVTPTLL